MGTEIENMLADNEYPNVRTSAGTSASEFNDLLAVEDDMKGWYFSNLDKKLRYGDGRVIRKGITHKVDCKPVLCESGLHASKNILDALSYAPGPYLWRVELGGEIIHGGDKSVGTERTYLEGFDATDILLKFARLCALDVVEKWNAPDVVLRFLKTGDPALAARAARAAWAAALAAHGAEAGAADAAARAARAARAAAWARAATGAAWAAWAAGAALRKKQNTRLLRMVNTEMRKRR